MDDYLNILSEKLTAMGESLVAATPRLVLGVVVLLIFVVVARLSRKVVTSLVNRFSDLSNLAKVFSRLTGIIVMFFGILMVAGIIFPSVTPASILGVLGLSSVAFGFAFKDILENFFAGILILLLRSFKIGDQIEVDGIEGTVVDIETRATIIRTFDNRKVVVPNATIFSENITVSTAYDKRRISVTLGIGYGDDIDTAKKIILEAVNKLEHVLNDPAPYVLVTGYGGSSVDLEIRCWLSPPLRTDILQMRDAILTVVKPALFGAGIDLPFPTQQLLLHDQTEASDGNRRLQREGWPAGEKVPASRWEQRIEREDELRKEADDPEPSSNRTTEKGTIGPRQ